jgi:hypothetical protein
MNPSSSAIVAMIKYLVCIVCLPFWYSTGIQYSVSSIKPKHVPKRKREKEAERFECFFVFWLWRQVLLLSLDVQRNDVRTVIRYPRRLRSPLRAEIS